MNTFYIPVHYFEREPEDNGLIKFFTNRNISETEFQKRLENMAKRYSGKRMDFLYAENMVDAIFNALAKEIDGIWEYCKTVVPLVIGNEAHAKNTKSMRKVNANELAALLAELTPRESMEFYETYNEETDIAEGVFGVVLLDVFESYVIFINCYGGGIPCVIEIPAEDYYSNYHYNKEVIEDRLTKYFDGMESPLEYVYVDTNLFGGKVNG